MKNKNHVITRNDIEQKCQKSTQSDVVIPNKLGNGDTCRGLRHWRLLSKLNNNFSKPVRNDMTGSLAPSALVPSVTNLFPYFHIFFSLKKKFAFTLAEVLITLGIIGIVAAMTIPTLIENYQKNQVVTKLQRAISVINQAYKLSYDDVGEPSVQDSFEMGPEQYFKTYWAPYLKVLTYCFGYAVCGYKKNYPFTYVDNSNMYAMVYDPTTRVSFLTADGFFYIVYTANYKSGSTTERQPYYMILVDINGSTGPNRAGRDVFLLTRTQEDGGGVQPYGYSALSQNVRKNCLSTGQTCADYIRRSGWKIGKDYPWKVKK